MGFKGCFFSTLGVCFKDDSSWGWNPSLNKWHGWKPTIFPYSLRSQQLGYNVVQQNPDNNQMFNFTGPSSLSLSIAPSASPTNLKQTLNGYIGLSSNYLANHQLNESLAWLNQSPVLTYFKASLFTIPMPHLWSILVLVYVLCRTFTHFNGIRQDWTSEHQKTFPKKCQTKKVIPPIDFNHPPPVPLHGLSHLVPDSCFAWCWSVTTSKRPNFVRLMFIDVWFMF